MVAEGAQCPRKLSKLANSQNTNMTTHTQHTTQAAKIKTDIDVSGGQ